MNAQLPIPTFEDFRKLIQFWLDQENKWFYFETGLIQASSTGSSQTGTAVVITSTFEALRYSQTRIVGRIKDVLAYPPSLLLNDAEVINVRLRFDPPDRIFMERERRSSYGLVFSQIWYFEPIEDVGRFLGSDARVAG